MNSVSSVNIPVHLCIPVMGTRVKAASSELDGLGELSEVTGSGELDRLEEV